MLLLTSLKNAFLSRITVTNLHCTDLTTVINVSVTLTQSLSQMNREPHPCKPGLKIERAPLAGPRLEQSRLIAKCETGKRRFCGTWTWENSQNNVSVQVAAEVPYQYRFFQKGTSRNRYLHLLVPLDKFHY